MFPFTFNTEEQGTQPGGAGLGTELHFDSKSFSFPLQISHIHLIMFASIILLCLCVVFLNLLLKSRRPKNFPPGPPILPILGNILNLSLENPLKDFERLRKSYGNVYSLFLGSRPAVIINGMKAMKEAMVTKGTDFAGRPQDLFVNDTQKKGVILAQYGSSWRDHRRFALTTLRNFGMGKNSMEERIHGEIDYTIDTLEKSIGSVWYTLRTCQNLTIRLMKEHKETRVPGEPRDFVDCYLDEMDKRGDDGSSFEEEQLRMYTLDLHFAGTDTTSNTLLTGFLYLMTYPHIQERCQQEIDEVLEGKDRASFDDRHNMPYMQAVIHEVQRIANTVPLSVPHCTTKDTELMGYSIPRGEFVKPEAFMPFSAGPRMCLGEGLARMELFLIMVTLLRKFKFIWPEDAGEPDYTPVYGVTLTPKPYRMEIQLRATQ
ncbi:hypothetical protein FQN60_014450 [Etheostoma spectabile]|uniref:Cytochrome P450 n=1 Tax=Etheostoma spectabile TaxID=54343 RepID=A0A5J5DCH3_9PERO|nr:hypothetical protein FQN60_014450 [Etheostoma spectabile]